LTLDRPWLGGGFWPSSGSKGDCITPRTYGYSYGPGGEASGSFGQTLSSWQNGRAHATGSGQQEGALAALQARLAAMETLLLAMASKL
jgi:hypothetical protein